MKKTLFILFRLNIIFLLLTFCLPGLISTKSLPTALIVVGTTILITTILYLLDISFWVKKLKKLLT